MSDTGAVDHGFETLYRELHRIAHRQLRGRGGSATLATTVVVHEAYLKLAALDTRWHDREHFMALAARVMRQVIVDYARARGTRKRGGDRIRSVGLGELEAAAPVELVDLLAIDAALGELEAVDERLARVVELRFFAGLTQTEIADAMRVTERTVERDWRKARMFLLRHLEGRGS